jgi:hypothetical protein
MLRKTYGKNFLKKVFEYQFSKNMLQKFIKKYYWEGFWIPIFVKKEMLWNTLWKKYLKNAFLSTKFLKK